MASTFPSAFIQSELNTNTEASPIQGSLELEKLGLPEHLYFSKDNLTFIENLGEGNFGKVFKAEAVNIAGIEGTTTVAVKTLKETVYEQTYVDFAKEAQVMVQLDHPNIVRLLGVSVSSGQPCLIFEFMSKGDLNHFLQSASPDMHHEEQKCKLKVSDLIAMAVYIASGMEYLARNRYVHRDLATRNCLVNEDNTVKLADFGLTRDVYDSDYYRVRGGAALPIRWMPPESIVYGRFTYTSDIWSFGIVLWEIFTFGKKPFYGMTNEAVIDFVVNRKGVPSPPSSCPFAVGNLILQCCQIDPKKRPPFTEILAVLLQAQLDLLHTSYKD
jgi:receptor tyrosine kinase-like orphan receptor 1